jgi:hypothetical protein
MKREGTLVQRGPGWFYVGPLTVAETLEANAATLAILRLWSKGHVGERWPCGRADCSSCGVRT